MNFERADWQRGQRRQGAAPLAAAAQAARAAAETTAAGRRAPKVQPHLPVARGISLREPSFLGAAAPLEAPTLHNSSCREQGACRSLSARRNPTHSQNVSKTAAALVVLCNTPHWRVGLSAAAAAAAHDGTLTGQAYTPARGLQDECCRPPFRTAAGAAGIQRPHGSAALWIVRPITLFFRFGIGSFAPMRLQGPSGRQHLLTTGLTPGTELFHFNELGVHQQRRR